MTRGFTLIEALVAIVVLAIVMPVAMTMLGDASIDRARAEQITRASWMLSAASEQILADASSDAPGFGMGAFEDPAVYLDDPVSGLHARLDTVLTPYTSRGKTLSVTIGALVSAQGVETDDASLDLYRLVTVRVSWIDLRGDAQVMELPLLLADVL
ncbi:MAG: type II secretion system protein [Planctomycetota bacterium]